MLAKVSFRSWPLKGVVAYYHRSENTVGQLGLSPCSGRHVDTHNHLINEDPQRPPVYCCCVSLRCNDFGRDVFYVATLNNAKNHELRVHAARWTARLPSVPTKEFVRKLAVHDMVSISGTCTKFAKQDTSFQDSGENERQLACGVGLTPLCSE